MTATFDAETNTWTPGQGWRFTNLHLEDERCRTRGCMIHNPDLRRPANREDWPYSARGDGRIERTCQHGVGHPDPDNARFLVEMCDWSVAAAWTHGCDGCCAS